MGVKHYGQVTCTASYAEKTKLAFLQTIKYRRVVTENVSCRWCGFFSNDLTNEKKNMKIQALFQPCSRILFFPMISAGVK